MNPPKSTDLITPKGPFPRVLSKHVLFLFCAGFYGANDVIYALDNPAVHSVVGVDSDCGKIEHMNDIYPEEFKFYCDDVFMWARSSSQKWNTVVVDPPIAMNDEAIENLWLWQKLSTKYVVLTLMPDVAMRRRLAVGQDLGGWRIETLMKRNAVSTYWMVLNNGV